MRSTIIGSGIFSLAIAKCLQEKGIDLLIWTHDASEKEREKWQGFSLTTDFKEAISFSDHLFFLVASDFMESIFHKCIGLDLQEKTIYIGSKGLLPDVPYYYSTYLNEHFLVKNIASFAGPNLAQDMILGSPTSITFSFLKNISLEEVEQFFPSRIYISVDQNIKETELASVLKNIYAIGSGILWEGRESKSTMISYLSQSFKELKTLIPNPSMDILGDFFLTGIMLESRNFTYGRLLKRKENTEEYLSTHTVEGVKMIPIIKKMISNNLPILHTLIDIVEKTKEPSSLEKFIFDSKYHE